jgi:hypothetical protein
MNKLNYIMPILVLGYSWYLKYTGEQWLSVATFVVSIFMWLIVVGNELNRSNK